MDETEIEIIVRSIKSSRKYRDLCDDTVRDVVAFEMARHRTKKEVLSAARRRLHRVLAPYLGEVDHVAAKKRLEEAFAAPCEDSIYEACTNVMAQHASTRERLGILSALYAGIFGVTGHPASLIDLACAVNPLSFRWMGLPVSVKYYAYDINIRTIGLINHYFQQEGLQPLAEVRDVLCSPPQRAADIAFLFKMYHCLEHRRSGAGWQVVERAPARWVAISFPTQNLASKTVDIIRNYDARIRREAASRGWSCDQLEFESEAILLIGKA